MFVPSKQGWWRLVFKYRGSELPRTKYRIAGVAAVAIVVTAFHTLYDEMVGQAPGEDDPFPTLTPLPFTLIGFALGVFLGFRNNAAYDRWWEGRKLWGALVNTTRSFARQILTLLGPISTAGVAVSENELLELKRDLVRRVIAFAHALRLALRDENDLLELGPFLSKQEIEALTSESNRPYAITQGLAERIRVAFDRGWIHPMHLPVLEGSMTSLTDIQGACERIKGTPIPFSYTTLIHRITAVYCYALPFGLVDQVGLFTPFVCTIIAYAFFGLDVVGDEIEQPFGRDANDLPLRSISRMIEINLRQRLGETDLPQPLKPVREILD